MNVTTCSMTRTLVQQYCELNKSEMREINGASAVCIPMKFADKGFSSFCVPHTLVDGIIMFPKLYTSSDNTVQKREQHEYLDKWVPVVNQDGLIDHVVLTGSEVLPWSTWHAKPKIICRCEPCQCFCDALYPPPLTLDTIDADSLDTILDFVEDSEIIALKSTSKEMK